MSWFRRIWTRTVLDLGRPKWRARERAIHAARRELEAEVFNAYREPSLSKRNVRHDADDEDRLTRCVAFGQFSNPIKQADQPIAQHGLFGTAAAFCVLSRSDWANSLNSERQPEEDEWHLRYLKTLNFLDLALRADAAPGDGVRSQGKMTLRVSLVMRAVAASVTPVRKLADTDWKGPGATQREAILNDICDEDVPSINRAPKEHAKSVVALISQCAAVPSRENGWFRVGTADDEQTWLFSIKDEAAPRVADEWVFAWSQVLVGLARLASASLIEKSDIRALCTEASFNAFVTTVLRPGEELDLDRRFQLMGLWALSHFDHHVPRGPLAVAANDEPLLKGTRFNLDEAKHKQLKRAIRTVSRDLLTREASLVDSWRPYTLKSSGQEWRDDSMVVPTVPVLLQLVARYHPHSLTESSLLDLVREACEVRDRRDIGRARPYQLGHRDGVVNLAYYHEAFTELAAAYKHATDSFFTRVGTTLHGMWWGYGRCGVAVLTVGATTSAYFAGVAQPSRMVWTLIFGIGASFLAAISTPPVIRFFWGDRF